MAGGWRLITQLSNGTDAGSDETQSNGVGLNGGASAFVKGSWVQLIASTSLDTSWVLVQFSSSAFSTAFDIGIGASGSEVVIVANMLVQCGTIHQPSFLFPLVIKAGTRIACRCSTDSAFFGTNLRMTLFADGALSDGAGSAIDTYGFNSASNSGVAVDPGGTANTKGAYAQITSSVTNDLAGFFLTFDQQNRNAGAGIVFYSLFDIAVGSSGSEIVILPDTCVISYSASGGNICPSNTPFIPLPIKAGSRIAARGQAATNSSPDRITGITLYGVRQ